MQNELLKILEDPLKFTAMCWPDLVLYDKQRQILESLVVNDETFVPAGHKLGKDFIAALATIWFFCSRSPCRIVTTSAGQSQLKSVLWGEMANFIYTSKYQLPIKVNDMLIRQIDEENTLEPKSYIKGLVTNEVEVLQGHHLAYGPNRKPRTMGVLDEASSIETKFYDAIDSWAHRKLIIGNCLSCTNFFFNGVKLGNVASEEPGRLYRKVIQIKASDSPNVKLGMLEKENSLPISGEDVVPGIIGYYDYCKRRATWDETKQKIGLDAEFPSSTEELLFPSSWLEWSNKCYRMLKGKIRNGPRAMGIDAGEGSANTTWTISDELGIITQESKKTKDTSVIIPDTIRLMKSWNVEDVNVVFDRGGGGKQLADILRSQGYKVRTVGFGESVTDPKDVSGLGVYLQAKDAEQQYTYKNRRSEMYGIAHRLLNPISEYVEETDSIKMKENFAIPSNLTELLSQLAPIPKLYDGEGRLYLPPKSKPYPKYTGVTLTELIGKSPDEADSFVLSLYGLYTRKTKKVVGGRIIPKVSIGRKS